MEFYPHLFHDIKTRIRQAQTKAAFAANAELIALYWDIGRMIHEPQQQQGRSDAVIPNLSRDIRNELPEIKGFSERNLSRMRSFYQAYPVEDSILPQPVAKLPLANLLQAIPWGHHAVLLEKVKGIDTRTWYMR